MVSSADSSNSSVPSTTVVTVAATATVLALGLAATRVSAALCPEKKPVEEETDIANMQIAYLKPDVDEVMLTAMPSYLNFINPFTMREAIHTYLSRENHEVQILDARKRKLSYEKVGFKLLTMEGEITDWDDEAQLETYKKEVEAKIRGLHPEAKRFVWQPFITRGGKGEQQAVRGSPHTDYYPNWKEYNTYIRENGAEHPAQTTPSEEPDLILGVWRPACMSNPVIDTPLALLDASTFDQEHLSKWKIDLTRDVKLAGIYETMKMVHTRNLAGQVRYSPDQRWYFYPYMTSREMLVIRHYTRGKFCLSPHLAIPHKKISPELQTRQSIESRVFVYFEEKDK